jgi:hypothetical protein
MKSRFLFSLLFLFLVVFSIGCIPPENSLYQKPQSSHGCKDSAYVEYQKESYHPKRTVAYLRPKLDSLASRITAILNDSRIKPKIRAKSLSFVVLPSGRFKRGSFAGLPLPDSQMLKDTVLLKKYYNQDSLLIVFVDSVAVRYRADSIPDYKPNLWVNGLIKNDSSKFMYSFTDSSCYVSGLTGGRSRASIMREVMIGLRDLKAAYNRTLRERPGLKGKITVKFAIDEFGKVIFAEAETPGTTIDDAALIDEFVKIVSTWKFGRIAKPGDVTEVVYPFVLSQ